MRGYSLAALVPFVLLSACMQKAEITSPPQSVSFVSQNAPSNFLRFQETEIRTFIGTGSERKEVVGLDCDLKSAEFTLSTTTPSLAYIPVYKGKPTNIYIGCEGGGYSAETARAPSIDGTIVGGASAAGLIVAAVTAGIAAGRNQWSYEPNFDITVTASE